MLHISTACLTLEFYLKKIIIINDQFLNSSFKVQTSRDRDTRIAQITVTDKNVDRESTLRHVTIIYFPKQPKIKVVKSNN